MFNPENIQQKADLKPYWLKLLLTFNLGASLGGGEFLCSQWKEGAASKRHLT